MISFKDILNGPKENPYTNYDRQFLALIVFAGGALGDIILNEFIPQKGLVSRAIT